MVDDYRWSSVPGLGEHLHRARSTESPLVLRLAHDDEDRYRYVSPRASVRAEAAGYEVDDDRLRVDLDVVWRFLSNEAYWNRWRTREDVEHQWRGAWRVVGVYDTSDGAMVGGARAISDGVSDAYLGDMFVLPDHRGRGLAKRLMRSMVDEGPGRAFRWMLVTSDAHGLYERFGFRAPDERVMVRPPESKG